MGNPLFNAMDRNIIIVDDDIVLAEIVKEMIVNINDKNNVRYFTDPRNALECIRQRDVHAIITDYSMPGMNGVELLERAPSVKTKIIMSGSFSGNPELENSCKDKGFFTLQKPFRWDQFRDFLEERGLGATNG